MKGTHWRTRPSHNKYHTCSCYCFLREWDIDPTQYEKLITWYKTNPFMNELLLVIWYAHSVRVCVCVCVSVIPETSRTGSRMATLLTPSWRASSGELHKLLFEPTLWAVWKKKPLKGFCQLHAKSCDYTVTLLVYLGHDESCQLQESRWNVHKGYALKGTPSTSRAPQLLLHFT